MQLITDTAILDLIIDWIGVVQLAVASFLDNLAEERKRLESEWNEKYVFSQDREENQKERQEALKKYHKLRSQIRDIDMLIKLPDRIVISEREKRLLYGDVLNIYGKAGIGKPQLLASKTQSLFAEERIGLLLVAGIYFTDDSIHEQIMKNIGFDYSFESLIDILETIGERDNCIVPVFICALNETWNRRLMPEIIPLQNGAIGRAVFTYERDCIAGEIRRLQR